VSQVSTLKKRLHSSNLLALHISNDVSQVRRRRRRRWRRRLTLRLWFRDRESELPRQKALPIYEPAIGPDIEIGPILAEQLVIELVQLERAADEAIDHQALGDRRMTTDMCD